MSALIGSISRKCCSIPDLSVKKPVKSTTLRVSCVVHAFSLVFSTVQKHEIHRAHIELMCRTKLQSKMTKHFFIEHGISGQGLIILGMRFFNSGTHLALGEGPGP